MLERTNAVSGQAVTLVDCLLKHERDRGDHLFWRTFSRGTTQREMSYQRLARLARGFAQAYVAAGVKPGDVALIFLKQRPAQMPAFLGAMLAGAIPSFMPCPSDKQHPSVYWPNHRQLLERVGDHILVTDRYHSRQMAENGLISDRKRLIAIEDVEPSRTGFQPASTTPETTALLQHSSGTTGLKKGVMLTHKAILSQVSAYAQQLGMNQDHNIVSWLPLYHDMGLIACAITPFVLGQSITCLDPYEWSARPVSLFEAIDQFGGDFVWMPNFAFNHLVRTVPVSCQADLSRVKAFINCSEPAKPETFESFAGHFARLGVRPEQLQVCYAMAETVFAVSQTKIGVPPQTLDIDADCLYSEGIARDFNGGEAKRVSSAGTIMPGLSVTVRKDDQPLPDGHVGEIAIAGDFLFRGYHNDPVRTAERIRDNTYYTRDLGFMRSGHLYVLGRKDDLLIINGRNLYAHEVEQIINAVAGAKPGRNVAFGLHNGQTGSDDLIIIAESDEAAREEGKRRELAHAIRSAVLDGTNIDVKACRVVEPGWLVKTTSGKISREQNQLKYIETMAASAAQAEQSEADSSGVPLPLIAKVIAGQFGCSPSIVTRETKSADIEGWDSLAHASVMLAIEQRFGISFPENELFKFRCVGEIADRIESLRRGPASATQRTVFDSERATIVCYGEPSDQPDLIVFAGYIERFGGIALMDFASLLGETRLAKSRRFFVTDKCRDWYRSAFSELTEALDRLSGRPKILLGNSMGGYAAVRFSNQLKDVVSVLAFVPQTNPLSNQKGLEFGAPLMPLRFDPAVKYCVLYGSEADAGDLQYVRNQLQDQPSSQVYVVLGSDHGVVGHLNAKKKLITILDAAAQSATMVAEIGALLKS